MKAPNFKVPVTKILEILPHTNAERLEIAKCYGFYVIVGKSQYQVGDEVIYCPIDSILPQWLVEELFPSGSKIKLNKSRVKQIKIRGAFSQGLLISTKVLKSSYKLEDDVAEILGITKYEPPTPSFQQSSGPKLRNKPFSNPHFRCFNGVTNIKWNPTCFDGEDVVIQEKLHGSHIRFGKAPFVANTFWKKVKAFLGLSPKYEFVYGSNNVELTNRKNYVGYYGGDIYGALLQKFDAANKLKDGEFVHGEVIGPGVQKGYTYGHKEHHLVIFDVRLMQEDGTQKWLDPDEAYGYAMERDFDFVPILYRGPFSKEIVDSQTSGPSLYCPEEKFIEGVVVKARYNYDDFQNKRAFKSINPDYLNTDPTDNH